MTTNQRIVLSALCTLAALYIAGLIPALIVAGAGYFFLFKD